MEAAKGSGAGQEWEESVAQGQPYKVKANTFH